MDEVWAEIPDYPNYAVSNYGEVVNIKFGRSLTPRPNKYGYLHVILFKNGMRTEWYIHQLVARVFLGDFRVGLQVQHIDGDKSNNFVGNLRLRGGGAFIEKNYKPTHIRGRRVKIVETGQTFMNAYAAADFIGGHASNIYACLRGKHKSHLGYTFEYVEGEVKPYGD